MGPLARRSVRRLARSGVWGLLVAGAFLLLATAAASVPIFAEAAGNDALTVRTAAVPRNAEAAQSPIVRVVGGEGEAGSRQVEDGLAGIPGLGPGSSTASSIGVELRPRPLVFTPFVAAGPPSGEGARARPNPLTERARIYGDDDLADCLLPAPGSSLPAPGSPATGSTSGDGGTGGSNAGGATGSTAGGVVAVWLPEPVARELRAAPGDEVQVGVQGRERISSVAVRVAGIYQVAADGRSPADPEGSRRWAYRRDQAPRDSEFRSRPAYLLVTDVAGATQLAGEVGDDLLYAVEGQLDPAVPTLRQAGLTRDAVLARRVEVRDPAITGSSDGLRQQVISGIPEIVDDATEVADRTVAWTTTAGAAGLALGLLAVLAVAVFGLVRRAVEVRHAVGLGLRPATIGALAAVEVVPVAVVCAGAGLLIGWLLVATVGPPGAVTAVGLQSAAWRAGLATGAGVLLIGAAAGLAAVRAAQLTSAGRLARTVPWEPFLVAVAVTATAGLFARPVTGGPPSALDLLVPVLSLAAVGAVGGRLLLALLAARTAPSTAGVRAAGVRAAGVRAPGAAWSRRPALALAVRRVAGGGRQAVLLVTVMTIGWGFLAYSFAAASSVGQVTADRSAVLAGARTTTEVETSWLLDPGAARLPQKPPGEPDFSRDAAPVPGVRNPPLQAGMTTVWRSRVTVPPEYGNLDLLVIDPRRFAEIATWGTGPELAGARALLARMAALDAQVTDRLFAGERRGPIPAIAVGPVLQRKGDAAAVSTLFVEVPITVLDAVPAFPGFRGALPLVVVPADSFFAYLGEADPRVRPAEGSGRFDQPPKEFLPAVWSATDEAAVQQFLGGLDVEPGNVTTFAQAEQQPDIVAARRATGYQIALGLCVAGLAVLGLAMFADRAAARARAADLLLARIGMGRRGTARARAAELATLALLSLLLAAAGVAVVVPLGARLLDPGAGGAPAFVLRVGPDAAVAAVAAAAGGLLLALLVSRPRRSADSGAVLRDAD